MYCEPFSRTEKLQQLLEHFPEFSTCYKLCITASSIPLYKWDENDLNSKFSKKKSSFNALQGNLNFPDTKLQRVYLQSKLNTSSLDKNLVENNLI